MLKEFFVYQDRENDVSPNKDVIPFNFIMYTRDKIGNYMKNISQLFMRIEMRTDMLSGKSWCQDIDMYPIRTFQTISNLLQRNIIEIQFICQPFGIV